MRIRRVILPVLTTAVLVVTGCTGSGPDTTSVDKNESPRATRATQAATGGALDFTAHTLDGKTIEGSSLAGRPTVLWFWAGWCPICRADAPSFKAAADKYGDRVNLIGVAGMGPKKTTEKFLVTTNLSGYTHLRDDYDPLWEKFRITAQDQFVLIDENGKLLYNGKLTKQQLMERVAALADQA